MKRLLFTFCILVSAIGMSAEKFYTPQLLAEWRDSMELVYVKDPASVDLTQMEAMVAEEADASVRAMEYFLMSQCYEAIRTNWSYRAAPGVRDSCRRRSAACLDSVLIDVEALAAAPALPWIKLMEDGFLVGDECLLEVLYPRVIARIPLWLLGNEEAERRLNTIANALARYGRREGEVKARCLQIVCRTDYDKRMAGLDSLMMSCLDTRASGSVLGRMMMTYQGPIREKMAMAEAYLAQMRPDAETEAVKNLMAQWMQPMAMVIDDNKFDGKEGTVVSYKLKNIREASLEVYKAEIIDKKKNEGINNMRRKELLEKRALRPAYEGKDSRVEFDTVGVVLDLKPGAYFSVLRVGEDSVCRYMRISTMDVLAIEDELTEKVRYRIVSVKDGSKVPGARLQHRWAHGEPQIRAYLSKDDHTDWDYDYRLAQLWDIYSIQERADLSRERRQSKRYVWTCELMTDRAIYRPGQTVEIAGVLGKKRALDGKTKTAAGRWVKITLRSDNDQLMKKRCITDRLGRVVTQYTIPDDAKPETYRLNVKKGKIEAFETFMVDNYRRPQAQMTMTSWVANDSCLFEANVQTAAGDAVKEMEVVCVLGQDTIGGEPDTLGRYYTMLEAGKIRIFGGMRSCLFRQQDTYVHASVTAVLPNGEMPSASASINLTKWPYTLRTYDIPHFFVQGQDTTIVVATNDDNEKSVPGIKLALTFAGQDTTIRVEGKSCEPVALPHFATTGTYLMSVCAEKADSLSNNFYLQHNQTIDVIVPEQTRGKVDHACIRSLQRTLTKEGVDLYVMTPYPDVTAHLFVVGDNGYEREWEVPCQGNVGRLHLPYDSRMGRKVQMNMVVICNGEFDEDGLTLTMNVTREPLIVGLNHFANKTHPGANEDWTVNVSDTAGRPVAGAAVVATMYDASLDMLRPMSSWGIPTSTYPSHYYHSPYMELLYGTSDWPYYVGKIPKTPKKKVPVLQGFDPNNKVQILVDEEEWYNNSMYMTKASFAGSPSAFSEEEVMNEVVVTGYGRISKALAGEVAGLQVVNTYGQPGTNSNIVIRGVGSISGNSSPLYVIDGVPYSGDISALDPSLIASTTILKDASATALYGARGANGVVVITTKDGSFAGSIDATDDDASIDPSAWLRKDFREVAMWSPKGRTNRRGEMTMQVSLPEQLSTWHLHMLVYDKKLRQATLDQMMRVEQPISLQPLWPRMVRIGDEAILMATARNRGTDSLQMVSRVEVRSADSASVLFSKKEVVTLPSGESMRLFMPMTVGEEWGDSVRMTWSLSNDTRGDGEQVWVAVMPADVQQLPDTTIQRHPKEVLREQLNKMKIGEGRDALSVALALYMAKKEGKNDAQAEWRLKRVLNKDGGFGWCSGLESSRWVTMQVMDMLLLEGEHAEMVRNAMTYLDNAMIKTENERTKMAGLGEERWLTNDDIHYMVLSSQVERKTSETTDSMLTRMDAAMRKHLLALKEVRASVHTPLTIAGVSTLGLVMEDKGTSLRSTAADHVIRLSLVKPEWGRYFKQSDGNSRLLTQLAAIDLMDTVGRSAEAREMRQWLAGQVWSRTWQSPILIYRGLDAFSMAEDTLTAMINDFSPEGLVTMKCEMRDDLQVGQTAQMRITLRAETEVNYLRITVPLAACLESANNLSGYRSLGGRWAYVEQYDDRMEIYLPRLDVGQTELTIDYRVLRPGNYTMPASSLRSEYWPEINCTTEAKRLTVE